MKNSLAFLIFCSLLTFVACDQYPYNQGKILYTNFCENCHMADGSGLEGVIPPLAGSDFLQKSADEIPCIIRHGFKGEMVVNGRTYNTEMVGIPRLTEFDITNIMNYMNTSWGHDYPIVKHLDVRAALKKCE